MLWIIMLFVTFKITYETSIGLRCDMIPEGVTAPKCTENVNRYKIEISGNPDSYIPEEQHTVFLRSAGTAETRNKFTYFIISVVNENPEKNIDSENSIGSLQLYGDALTKFSDRCQNAIVEADGQPKFEIQFLWLAPPKGSGCIKFRATVVESMDIWYSKDGDLTKILCEEASDTEDTQSKILKHCCTCDEAKYEVTFEGLWSRNTHPKDFPSNGRVTRFSDIIGASHTVNYSFWNYGDFASEGLQQLAEYGNTRLLESELKAKSDNIRTIIKARGISFPNITGKTFAVFRVDNKHHLMSIVSMVDPSPDWIVGVSGLELCLRNCSWVESKLLNLYPWDVGTDEGITYLSVNQPSPARQPIRRLNFDWPDDPRSPFYDPTGTSLKPFARLKLSRQRLYEKSCDYSANEETDDSNTNCETTEWSEWSSCSVTCGRGIKYKQRMYKYEESKYVCHKKLTERSSCEAIQKYCPQVRQKEREDPLCELGPWSSWSSCSVTCGKGTQTRDRKFKNRYAAKRCKLGRSRPLILQQNLECWDTEKCDNSEDQVNDLDCPERPWTDWSPCSATCNKGYKERYKLSLKYTGEQSIFWPASKLKDLQNNQEGAEDLCERRIRETVECYGRSCEKDNKLPNVAVCGLSKDVGACKSNVDRWYFDMTKGQCEIFSYSGCEGNENNFNTLEQCQTLCTTYQSDFDATQVNELNDDCDSTSDEKRDFADTDKIDGEFHLAQETCEGTPRSNHSKSSSSEVFSSSIPKKLHGRRPVSGRTSTPKSPLRHAIQPLSSIPLPVKSSGPIKVPPLIKNVRSSSRTNSIPASRTPNIANKHTLEIQFINKNKRYIQMKREIVEKQRPVLDLYQGLVQIKKKLEELGKTVKLEDIKLLTYEEYKKPIDMHGAGEQVSMEVVAGMKHSIEEIPKTLMDICKNLLSRRALIVELLESVTKAEVDVSEVSDKIESLKNEGQQLQHSLDAVISEHQCKINILVGNWQKLLNDKQSYNADNKIEELEGKLEHQERLTLESNNMIHDLHRKMEERKSTYERSITEHNGVIQSLQEQKNKIEQELENEKKTTVDYKNRNSTNAQNLKTMRSKITELENEKGAVESSNAEMQKKIRLLQDQIKHKETSWSREREELTKSLKHQENLLQKLTAEKNQFETRFKTFENAKRSTELKLQSTINSIRDKLKITNNDLEKTRSERNEALKKCTEFENYIARMRIECRETMNKVSYSIEWGKDVSTSAAESYIHEIAKDVRIRELEDRIYDLENDKEEYAEKGQQQENMQMEPTTKPCLPLLSPEDITSYQLLLRESENKLQEKLNDLRSTEIENLRSEIRQLKVRQVALEEQNTRCPTSELQQMVEEGQRKLHELMKRSMESEHTVEKYVNVIEKQTYQINEMENMLRYKENMANVLKSSREELLREKESLVNYSQEMRMQLAKVTKQEKIKGCLARELEEKVYLRERQIVELKELVEKLEANLLITNEERFKLQEKIETLQKKLENKKEHTAHTPKKYKSQSTNSDNLIPRRSVNDCISLMPIQSPDSQSLAQLEKKYSCYKKCSSRVRNNVILEPKSGKSSNHKMENIQFSILSDRNSDHSSCQHQANSRSLISLSLQTVDFLKTRLNFLTSVNMLPENTDIMLNARRKKDNQSTNSAQTTRCKKMSQENVGKIIKFSAKRYKYLQKQTNESYEDLTKLVRFAVSQQGGVKKIN